MNDRSKLRSLIWSPAMYRIRVGGRLQPEWSERLQGMSVCAAPAEQHAAVTELSGVLPDQAALMGVLVQLYDNGLPLLSVESTAADERESDLSERIVEMK